MRALVPLLVAVLVPGVVMAGCAAPQDENADAKPSRPAVSSHPSVAPLQPYGTPSTKIYPDPRPTEPRVGEPFTAAILASGGWVTARITLTAVDSYTGKLSRRFGGGLLLFRWKAVNLGDRALSAAVDPISYRFAGLDAEDRRTSTLGYERGGSPPECQIVPGRIVWKPGQTLHGCSAQELPEGSRLARAAFLSGDPRNPQTVEFFLD